MDWRYRDKSRRKTVYAYEEVVTDPEATKKKICARLSEAYTRYTKSMKDWESNNFNQSMELIGKEIDACEQSYLRKKAAAVEMQALSKLDCALKAFVEQVKKALPDSKFTKYEETYGSVFTAKKVEVTPYAGAVLELSRSVLQQQHRAIARSFVSAIGCKNYTPIVIAWDDNSSEE